MSPSTPGFLRFLVGNLARAFGVSLTLGAGCAVCLLPFFHGDFDQGRSDGWTVYFGLPEMNVDAGWIFKAFLIFFLATPLVLAIRQTFRAGRYRYHETREILMFGGLIVVGIVWNLMVAMLYLAVGWNKESF
jgi:hypothetical protein